LKKHSGIVEPTVAIHSVHGGRQKKAIDPQTSWPFIAVNGGAAVNILSRREGIDRKYFTHRENIKRKKGGKLPFFLWR
jgi:hypothetical protein